MNSQASKADDIWRLRRGSAVPPPQAQTLLAGTTRLLWEDGALRQIHWGGVEIVRGLYAAVRDENWLTIPGRLVREEVTTRGGGFDIRSERLYTQGAIHFTSTYHVIGNADSITFRMLGEARSAFRANRIGFCVLHPLQECVGTSCRITHSDGTVEETRFPDLISPHQPFLDIRAMEWWPSPGCTAQLEFRGDVFETEDQRNWTDASLKTYCTPLALPYPLTVEVGHRVEQSVTLRIRTAHAPPKTFTTGDAAVRLHVPPESAPRPLPPLGLGHAPGTILSGDALAAVREIGASHLRTEIWMGQCGWAEAYAGAQEDARRLGVPLDLVVFFSPQDEQEGADLAKLLQDDASSVRSILLLSDAAKTTPPGLVERVAPVLRHALPRSLLGAGTDAYLAELNRNLLRAPGLDFLCFSANPQVHAEDDRTLFENTAALADAVRTARVLAAGRAVHVSPITLRRRRNPDATSAAPTGMTAGSSLWPPDPRQCSLLGAAWTLGAVKSLAESGADSVTLFEVAGPGGLLGGPAPQSATAEVFPVYLVLRELWGTGPARIQASVSTDPLRIHGLAWEQRGRRKILIANGTAQTQRAQVLWGSEPVYLRVLSEKTADHYCRRREDFVGGSPASPDGEGRVEVRLRPYAVAVLEGAIPS